MHLLVLTNRGGGGKDLLPALEYLDHTLEEGPLEEGSQPLTGISEAEVILVDATRELAAAAAACRAATVHELHRPVVMIVSESSLAALKATWGFADWMLPGASPVEIETRLRVVASRAADERGRSEASVGDLVVDEDSYQVRLGGDPLDLTYKEFELLKALANSPNRVFSRELLLQEVWGYDYYGGSRTIDVHVRRLRAKLGPEYESMIETVRGVGYKLVNRRRGAGDADEEGDPDAGSERHAESGDRDASGSGGADDAGSG